MRNIVLLNESLKNYDHAEKLTSSHVITKTSITPDWLKRIDSGFSQTNPRTISYSLVSLSQFVKIWRIGWFSHLTAHFSVSVPERHKKSRRLTGDVGERH